MWGVLVGEYINERSMCEKKKRKVVGETTFLTPVLEKEVGLLFVYYIHKHACGIVSGIVLLYLLLLLSHELIS